MKKTVYSIAAVAMIFAASCSSAPEADKAQTGDAQTVNTNATGNTYKADLAASSVAWTGTKPTGKHTGTFTIKEGSLMADANAITGGKFVMEIGSMKITDADTNGASKLVGHLSSPDFFDAGKYPTATFEITGVKAGVDSAAGKELVMKDATHTVTGNLTLKDVTKSVTFPAKVTMTDANITADANFNIDRTQWNMKYNSGTGFGDKMINDQVNLVLHLVANK